MLSVAKVRRLVKDIQDACHPLGLPEGDTPPRVSLDACFLIARATVGYFVNEVLRVMLSCVGLAVDAAAWCLPPHHIRAVCPQLRRATNCYRGKYIERMKAVKRCVVPSWLPFAVALHATSDSVWSDLCSYSRADASTEAGVKVWEVQVSFQPFWWIGDGASAGAVVWHSLARSRTGVRAWP